MLAQVHSFVLQGIDPLPCEVEVDVAEVGMVKTTVVGSKRPNWAWLVGLVLGFLATVSGCSSNELITWHESTPEGREASFENFEHLEVDGIPLRKHVANYTCLLYVNAAVNPERWRRQSPWVGVERIDKDRPFGRALAVPLTTDGYLLTCAHVVQSEYLQLLVPGDEYSFVPARLVWRSQDWLKGQQHAHTEVDTDFAIIHANVEWDHVPAWVDVHSLKLHTPVVTGTADPLAPIGGEFLGIPEIQAEMPKVQMKWFAYTAPAIQGDSGGPVMLSNGQLIGIHGGSTEGKVEVTYRRLFISRTMKLPLAVGVAPDLDDLMKIIDEDRYRQRNSALRDGQQQ